MDSISVTVTGKLGSDPASGVTQSGITWAAFSLAVDVPARKKDRTDEHRFETRWYKVWCYDALADHVASSLVKGDMVTVRADGLNCSAWIDNTPEGNVRGRVELTACDVAASMRWETLTTAKRARTRPVASEVPAADGDPWAGGGQVTTAAEVPDVLAGLTR